MNAFEIHQLNSAIDLYAANPNVNDFILFVQNHKGILNQTLANALEDFYRNWSTNPQNTEYINQSTLILKEFVTVKMNVPVVGASGAVFGLLLAFGMLFPNAQLMMIFLPIPIKAKYFVMIYGGLELYQGISANPSDNVAHFAHLGGMLFGFIMIKIWNRNNNQFNRFN